jgi:DNA-binding CsgD family transcriptional regulator
MEEAERVLAVLIGDIYDASLDRTSWPGVFERICSYVGGRSATPESQDKVRRFVDLHFSWGLDDHYLKRYSNDGLVDDEMRRRLGVVVPHVRRALLITKIIDLPKIEAAAFADMLDGLSAGLFLVGASGGIVHANASGHALVREGRCLSAHGGRLRAADPQANHSLQDIFAAAAGGDVSVGDKAIAVPLKSRDGERYVAHVLPLTAGPRRKAGTSYAAVAAVFVRKAELDLQSPFEAIAQDFRLTPGELRVLFGIVDIGGVPQVASVLGVSETTVKTHLQRLFEKTTTSRQADLVKLVAGYTSPLALQLGAKPQPGNRVATTARF